MRNTKPGLVAEGLWYLGRKEAGVYILMDKGEAALINGSLSVIIPDVLEQAQRFGIDIKRITKAIIPHAHFDHVGIIPYLARQNPQMHIFASARAKDFLKNPNIIKTINDFSRTAAALLGKNEIMNTYDTEWRDDVTIDIIGEGNEITIGSKKLLVMEIPGHSSCSLAFYESSHRALFPSDCGGIPFANTIVPSGNSNFTRFQEGLSRLCTLPVKYYCSDHYGFITGREAKDFGAAACSAAAQLRCDIESALANLGSVETAASKIIDDFYNAYPGYFLDRMIMAAIVLQMVKHIAKGTPQKAS